MNIASQLFLFPEQETKNVSVDYKYQIKRFDDPYFKVEISIPPDVENPESLVLDHLGYFVIPQMPTDL